ncbi:MAG: carboxylating nicotinate-nucleotide diphosphorylase [Spirochaetaceae bacterium]|nr:MAG: carboxylating nicotinate-nucleotide diphosphorylase [Spirochaetaceae bacterium]
MDPAHYRLLIETALQEDLGTDGDVTCAAVFTDEHTEAHLISKDSGILAGRDVFTAVFSAVDATTEVTFMIEDGTDLGPGDHIATVQGNASSVFSAERVALNVLSFLTGIASTTRRYVDEAAAGGRAMILDTRKTLPGYRALSKYAVRVGGARNHRLGLYDMVLLKDNHIDRAGSITSAVERVRRRWESRYRIEVECRTVEDVIEAHTLGVDMIMLDNMNLEHMRESVALCAGTTLLEASGNMDLSRIREVSATGVDYISVGALTHSVQSFDFSLLTAGAG